MRTATFCTLGWLFAVGCSPPPPNTTPPTPPQAFITVADTTVIGTSIKGTTSTSGCTTVAQVQILEQGSFLADANSKGPGSAFEIPAALLMRQYSARGLAVPLTLSAKVVCDDGRTNTSQTVGVTFFPVVSTFQPEGGGQAVPDSFVAEGGFGGSGTTFIGCIGTATGTALARVDTQGNTVKQLDAMPFACSAGSYISEKSPVKQVRWLMEPSRGAFAFDSNLNVTAQYTGVKVKFIGVAKDGDALLVIDSVPQTQLVRVAGTGGTNNTALWSVPFSGIMNTPPVVDAPNDTVWTSAFNYNGGAQKADIDTFQLYYSTGALKDSHVITTLHYANMIDIPVTPMGAFNADGTILYLPLMATDAYGNTSSVIYACATNAAGCQNNSRRWASQAFSGQLTTVAPYGSGGYIVAAGPTQVHFLTGSTGATASHGGNPITPTGSQLVLGIQPGTSTELYVLNGPPPPATGISYPTEVVAIDKPEDGELYRFDFGAGGTPAGGIALAVDDNGQAWFRVGTTLVKPQTLQWYRSARGPSP